MIAKMKDPIATSDRFEQAGAAAEEQMAFYLRRAFGDDESVHVINDLRLVEDGDCAQIDHLVLHPWGMFVVESKSVSGEVEVNQHDEWVRKWSKQRTGMPSPIQQAKRQGEFLHNLLRQHDQELLDKRLFGQVQPGFRYFPIEVCVAISDKGIITRKKTDPPELMKADHVCEHIKAEIARHRKASGLLSRPDGDYGVRKLRTEELERVKDFLLARHSPRGTTEGGSVAAPVPPRVPESQETATANEQTAAPSCKHCGSRNLVGSYGKYGYYFKCGDCDKNTPIDYACTACGKKGRIRKSGGSFRRVCEACGHEEQIWQNR